MKKFSLSIILLICFLGTGFSQSQFFQNFKSTFSSNPNSLFFITENEGWVCGSDGMIAHTTNGGTTWENQNSNVTVALRDIFFLDKNNGFIVGDDLNFLKTTDGGKTWTKSLITVITDATTDLYQVKFLSTTTGCIIGYKSSTTGPGYVLKTTDGGATWKSVLSNTAKPFLSMYFASATNGIIGGKDFNSIYYTTDGGTTWVKSDTITTIPPSISYSRSDLWAAYMVDNNVAYLSGWGSSASGLQPTIYLKSTNGGKTWVYLDQKTENRSYYNNQDMYFKDANTGIAVGGNSSTVGGWIYKTTDGGANWTPQPLISGVQLLKIAGFGNVIYILGAYGNLFKTTDMGATLTSIIPNSAAMNSISFPSANVGYAGTSSNPGFFKTTDGGFTWKTKFMTFPSPTPIKGFYTYYAKQITFPSENVGYAVYNYGIISKTTDGGNTWNVIFEDGVSNHNFNAIYMLDNNTGWAVGRWLGSTPNYLYGIVKITNGSTVTKQDTSKAGELAGVHFADPNNGVAVGKGGNIVYTTNGGTNWTKATSTSTASLTDVKFITPQAVVAVGDTSAGSATILLSLDGGKNWVQPSTQIPLYRFNQITIKQPSDAYICGYFSPAGTIKGTVIKLSLAGTSVSLTDLTDTSLFVNNLTAITVSPAGDIWTVATDNSLIFSTKKTSGVEIPVDNLKGYSLSQNYPNPFNPSTTIEWNIPKAGNVEIKVFDILGKEVTTLLNNRLNAGKHRIVWDGKNNFGKSVSSGMYYYRIKMNNYVDVKKMMYIR